MPGIISKADASRVLASKSHGICKTGGSFVRCWDVLEIGLGSLWPSREMFGSPPFRHLGRLWVGKVQFFGGKRWETLGNAGKRKKTLPNVKETLVRNEKTTLVGNVKETSAKET